MDAIEQKILQTIEAHADAIIAFGDDYCAVPGPAERHYRLRRPVEHYARAAV